MLRTRSCLNACLSIAAVAAPTTIASSSTPALAQTVKPQTVEPQLQPMPIQPAALPSGAEAMVAPDLPAPDLPTAGEPAPASAAIPRADAPPVDPRQVECVAKIIVHEAATEPREGRVAVAQVIRTRMRDRRFAPTACAVARQRGQFFDVDAFNPSRATDRWQDAVAIATHTLNGGGDDVAPGALFFHAAYSPMPGHQRVTQIGGHVFYR